MIREETNASTTVNLFSNNLVVLGRIDHSVQMSARAKNTLTINAFYKIIILLVKSIFYFSNYI